MPVTIELNGQRVSVEERDLERVVRSLIDSFRRQNWMPERNTWDNVYRQWEWHARSRVMDWICGALGGAILPSAAAMNMVNRMRDRLDGMLTPARFHDFLANLPNFVRASARARQMFWEYTAAFEQGGARAVTGLTFVRDRSFDVLSILVTVYTAGAAAPVGAAATAQALAGSAGINFLLSEGQSAVGYIGRRMAGDDVSTAEMATDLAANAFGAMSDALLGRVFEHLLPGISNRLAGEVLRNRECQRILQAAGIEMSRSVVQGLVTASLTSGGTSIGTVRDGFAGVPNDADQATTEQAVADRLAQSRGFQDQLGQAAARQGGRRR